MGSISKDKKNLGSAVAAHWPCADADGWSGQLNLSCLSWVDNCSCPESTVRLTSQQQPPQHKASPWYEAGHARTTAMENSQKVDSMKIIVQNLGAGRKKCKQLIFKDMASLAKKHI